MSTGLRPGPDLEQNVRDLSAALVKMADRMAAERKKSN